MLSKADTIQRKRADVSTKILSGVTDGIKVLNAALEERGNGALILRGSISPESLRLLRKDDYQREVLAESGGRRTSRLRKGIEAGVTLPDIELGMRGQNFSSRGSTVVLHDPVYIIDGLQRVSAMTAFMEEGGEVSNTNPLGATVHFSTNKEWEKERFAALNQLRTPVSPNVMLRNSKDAHPSVLTLYGLSTNEPGFALYERVCWNQRMAKNDLVSAMALLRAATGLHKHIIDDTLGDGIREAKIAGAQVYVTNSRNRGPVTLDRVAKSVGLNNFRANVRDFFDLIDECWGIRTIEYGEATGHLRGNFISTLSSFLSKNEMLWDAARKRFHLDAKTKARLKSFPVNDPEIRRLSSAGTMVLPTLYMHLLTHMNKGKSKHKFK